MHTDRSVSMQHGGRLFGLLAGFELNNKNATDNEIKNSHSRIKAFNQSFPIIGISQEGLPQNPQLTLLKGDGEMFSAQIHSIEPYNRFSSLFTNTQFAKIIIKKKNNSSQTFSNAIPHRSLSKT